MAQKRDEFMILSLSTLITSLAVNARLKKAQKLELVLYVTVRLLMHFALNSSQENETELT